MLEQQDQQLAEMLTAACQKYLGTALVASDLKRLSGGASAETWQFKLTNTANNQNRPVILRCSSVQQESQFSTSISKNTEALIQQHCRKAGIPVPEILFCLQAEDGIGEGYVMSCAEGETIPRKILRDKRFATARNTITSQCGNILGKLHQIDCSPLKKHLQDQSPIKQLEQLEKLYRSYQQPSAVFEIAFRWLKENAPQNPRYTLVHGDFRNGNLVVNEQGIHAVLDWELCHLGDPIEDLGWLCVNAWCFGSDKPVGGFGEIPELINAYKKQTGIPVTENQIRYWQIFGTLRWGIICMFQVNCYLLGLNKSMELAAIGRRVSETEIDLLNLLG